MMKAHGHLQNMKTDRQTHTQTYLHTEYEHTGIVTSEGMQWNQSGRMQLEELGSLISDYTTKLEQSEQNGTGTKTNI